MPNYKFMRIPRTIFAVFGIFAFFALWASAAEAASFQLTPVTGSFNTGSRFTVTVSIDSEGAAINAAEGVISFDARYLTVESISTDVSIFKFWVQEPKFSNAAGTVSFSGGLTSPGYTGPNGKVLTVTFQGTGVADELTLKFTSGAILANDGFGTNVLTSSQETRYKISAVRVSPPAQPLERPTLPTKLEEEEPSEVPVKIEPPRDDGGVTVKVTSRPPGQYTLLTVGAVIILGLIVVAFFFACSRTTTLRRRFAKEAEHFKKKIKKDVKKLKKRLIVRK